MSYTLKEACKKGDINKVKKCLKKGDNPFYMGNLILNYTCEKGQDDVIKLLLEDIIVSSRVVTDDVFYLPIQLAIENDRINILRLLLEHIKYKIPHNQLYSQSYSIIDYACKKGHYDILMKTFIYNSYIDPSYDNNVNIITAHSYGHIDIVNFFLLHSNFRVTDNLPNDIVKISYNIRQEKIEELLYNI